MGKDCQIAVVGYSFRLPGTDRDTLWDALLNGNDLVSEVEDWRWAKEAYLHPDKAEPGKSYTFSAGAVDNVAGFDAGFFGISPREAEQMDPQQRFLLEMSWEAFEDAGVKPSTMKGSRCAVYVGFSSTDYAYRRFDDLASIDSTVMTGNTGSIAANRLSYFFDLRGPSMAVDTACSSTMVAFHQACQSIRSGETNQALVGGISLHLHPFSFIGFSKATMLSERGICNVFDASGDGYVRSEGGGIFFLKKLKDAIADGNRIHAVVAASGVNCDGHTNGITIPSYRAQADLLREVYDTAGINADEIDYFEAHGTGTAVGDPVEAQAIGRALGQFRSPDKPLLLGSVKSNLGHLEAASAVAGLVKALLSIRYRKVPPTIHLNTPNPEIDFKGWNLEVVTEPKELAASGNLLLGINSFGFGGANAHVVLRGHSVTEFVSRNLPDAGITPLILSAKSGSALCDTAKEYAGFIEATEEQRLYDVRYHACFHRDRHKKVAIFSSAGQTQLTKDLKNFADGKDAVSAFSVDLLEHPSQPVFVYSGNGSQWLGMGAQLLKESKVFRKSINKIDKLCKQYGPIPVTEVLEITDTDSDAYELTEIAQPALFAVQVGITEMLRAWGCMPAAVVGHSVGEVAAAWACGALTLEQAVHVIFERSTHQGKTRGIGGMTAVGMGAEDTNNLLQSLGLGEKLVLAGINSPRGVTIAGEVNLLSEFETVLAEREIFQRRLRLDYAFHSPAMDPIRDDLESGLRDLAPQHDGAVAFYSTVLGKAISGNDLDAQYWWLNIRKPVKFQAAITALIKANFNVFVEIGPHSVLRNYVSDSLRSHDVDGRVIGTMQKGDGSASKIQRAFYQVLGFGVAIDLTACFPVKGDFIDLPIYPWQHEQYWHPISPETYGFLNRNKVHPLLGYRLAEETLHWENQLDIQLYPTLENHAVGGTVVFPAAGFVEMALAASMQWKKTEHHTIDGLEIRSPLLLEADHAKMVRFRIDDTDGSFTVKSRKRLSEDAWTIHAVGRILDEVCAAPPGVDLDRTTQSPDYDGSQHYRMTNLVGLDYGPAFRAVTKVWCDDKQVVAEFKTPGAIDGELAGSMLHPAFLDGCFQLLVDVLASEIDTNGGIAFVPIQVGNLVLYKKAAAIIAAQGTLIKRSPRSVVMDYVLFDDSQEVVAVVKAVRFRAIHLKKGTIESNGYFSYKAIPKPIRALREFDSRVQPAFIQSASLAFLGTDQYRKKRQEYAEEVEPLLESLCASFAERALRQLTHADIINPANLMKSGRIKKKQVFLLEKLLGVVVEDGLLEPIDEGFRWISDLDLPEPEDIWVSLLGDYPDYSTECLLIGRVGAHLAQILLGDIEVGTLLSNANGIAGYHHFISDTHTFEEQHLAIAEVLKNAIEQLPCGNRLRILEIASCSSQMNMHVLPHVDFDQCDYTICAADDQILVELESLLERFPAIETLVDDLSHSGVDGHGTLSGDYDFVLLAHGLAHSPSIEKLLNNVSRLLSCSGQLLVVERGPDRLTDIVFGIDPGWWLQDDGAHGMSRLRTSYHWAGLLRSLGYQTSDLLAESYGAYLLTGAMAQEAVRDNPREHRQQTWLIMQRTEGYSAELAAGLAVELESAGHKVVHSHAGHSHLPKRGGRAAIDEGKSSQIHELFDTLGDGNDNIDGVIYLAGLSLSAEFDMQEQVSRCMDVTALVRACEKLPVIPKITIVTRAATTGIFSESFKTHSSAVFHDPQSATLWGFGRTLINEYPDVNIRLIDLVDMLSLERASLGLMQELIAADDDEDEVILSGNGRFVPRLQISNSIINGAAEHDECIDHEEVTRLEFSVPGPLKHLEWRSNELAMPAVGEVEIEVRAAGLNFRDVMYAMGLLPDEAVENGFAGATLGMELSGVVAQVGEGVSEFSVGDEVIAFSPSSFATKTVTSVDAVVLKPDDWSFEAAATVPTAFFTVYYSLVQLAHLAQGEKVLIHGAAGGVGIAAIQMAKYLGAEIFATAGSDKKRDFVRLLGADHVFDSRSLSFAEDILRVTDGEGVDVVLNSLAGEAVNKNLQVLKPFGRFLELGKRDFYENTKVGLRPFRNNISYFGIDADQLMRVNPALAKRFFRELMGLFQTGELKPLPYRAFFAGDMIEAFRFMQQSRQIGKIVLTFNESIKAKTTRQAQYEGLRLRPDATYLVTGGLSGFGLRTASWLVEKGARNLLLISRRGASSEEAKQTIEVLTEQGVHVEAVSCDVTDESAMRRLFVYASNTMPPIKGVVHAAMVIADGLARNLDAHQLHTVFAPKIQGARHLDQMTRELELDFFILYSSATTLFGNPGQANYIAANYYLEALAESRRMQGLPAMAVCWGAIEDVGYLARNEKVKQSLQSRMGGRALSSEEALNVLERLMQADISSVGIMDLDWHALRRFLPSAEAPKFSHLARQAGGQISVDEGDDIQRLVEELSEEELRTLFIDMLKKEIGVILRIPPERLDAAQSVFELGMDSLMGMELIAAVEESFGIALPIMALSEGPTIESIVARIIREFRKPRDEDNSHLPQVDDHVQHLVSQHGGASEDLIEELSETFQDKSSVSTGSLLH